MKAYITFLLLKLNSLIAKFSKKDKEKEGRKKGREKGRRERKGRGGKGKKKGEGGERGIAGEKVRNRGKGGVQDVEAPTPVAMVPLVLPNE